MCQRCDGQVCPDRGQDLIRFRNLVKALEESLRQKYSTRDVRPLLEPFQRLARDRDFWYHSLDGLAVLGAPGLFRVYRLQRPIPELAVVAESFHLKPLIRILQSAGGYQVLGLSRQKIASSRATATSLTKSSCLLLSRKRSPMCWERFRRRLTCRPGLPLLGLWECAMARVRNRNWWTMTPSDSSARLTARSCSSTRSHRSYP